MGTPTPHATPTPQQEKGRAGTAFHRDNLHPTIFDLFIAGTESTSITLRYCLLLLLEHPEVAGGDNPHPPTPPKGSPRSGGDTPLMSPHLPPTTPLAEKVAEEVERVVGAERAPALGDRGAMAYTEAVLHEAQRHLDLVPLGFIRTVRRDTPLGGFTLPKVR